MRPMTASGETIPCPSCACPVAIAAGQQPATFPFCCARCRLLDLGAWADGTRVIPGQPLVYDPYADDVDQLPGGPR